MSVVVVGLNHRTVPLELLERVNVSPARLPKVLGDLAGREHISEVVVLSTCHRTEVYAVAERYHGAVQDIRHAVSELAFIPPEDFSDHLYTYSDEGAVNHLFSVAAGLDSVVLGESEVPDVLVSGRHEPAAGRSRVGSALHLPVADGDGGDASARVHHRLLDGGALGRGERLALAVEVHEALAEGQALDGLHAPRGLDQEGDLVLQSHLERVLEDRRGPARPDGLSGSQSDGVAGEAGCGPGDLDGEPRRPFDVPADRSRGGGEPPVAAHQDPDADAGARPTVDPLDLLVADGDRLVLLPYEPGVRVVGAFRRGPFHGHVDDVLHGRASSGAVRRWVAPGKPSAARRSGAKRGDELLAVEWAGYWRMPRRKHTATAEALSVAPSFANSADSSALTVDSETPSWRAICSFVRPSATSRTTSSSLEESSFEAGSSRTTRASMEVLSAPAAQR